jgi:hypothetical protein
MHRENVFEGCDNDIFSFVPLWVGIFFYDFRLRKRYPTVERYNGIWIRSTRKFVRVFESLSSVESHSHYTNSLINGGAREHLCDLDGEDVGSVHDRSNIGMNLLQDKRFQARNEVDIKTKCLASKRLADVIDGF